jgi:phosphoribosylanthranilate isomerase
MRVKICGVRSADAAREIVRLGADAIGVLGALTVEKEGLCGGMVSWEESREIVRSLPPLVDSVLVTDYDSIERIIEACSFVGCKSVQICGFENFGKRELNMFRDELPGLKVINVINVTCQGDVEKAADLCRFSDAILLDSKIGNQLGGTGRTHDWNVSRQIVEASSAPVILAGGLNPGNIRAAIEKVGPWAVDVQTGVENPDGTKNFEKVMEFIGIAKGA